MPRNLEEYLKSERARLDVEAPDDRTVWEVIEKRLPGKPEKSTSGNIRARWIRVRNIAASLIIIFCLGYITKDIVNTIGSRRSVTLSAIDSQLGKKEERYRTMVSLRTHEVSLSRDTDNPVVKQLFSELEDLDAIYNQSMNDLRVLGPNEKVINTIFDTYENKIRILELIILETNRTQIHENNEKIKL